MGKAKHAFARTIGKPDYSALPDRLAFEKACADKQCQAKNGHDESRVAKREDVHEGHMELLTIHQGMKKPGSLLLRAHVVRS